MQQTQMRGAKPVFWKETKHNVSLSGNSSGVCQWRLLFFQLDEHVKWIKITKNYKLLAINDSGRAEVVP